MKRPSSNTSARIPIPPSHPQPVHPSIQQSIQQKNQQNTEYLARTPPQILQKTFVDRSALFPTTPISVIQLQASNIRLISSTAKNVIAPILTDTLYAQLADSLSKHNFETAMRIAGVSSMQKLYELTCPTKRTLLIVAAQAGHTEIIKALFNKLRNPDSFASMKDNYGWTALMHAASAGNTESMKAIISCVIHPELLIFTFDSYGFTALMAAAHNGGIELIKALLSKVSYPDALANMKDTNGQTALMQAAKASNVEAIKSLLSSVFCPDVLACVKDAHGMTALMYASHDAESIKAILSSVRDPDLLACMIDLKGWTALMLIAIRGNAETTKALLDNVKNPKKLIYFSNNNGITALMLCAKYDNDVYLESNSITAMLDKLKDESDPDTAIFLTDSKGMNAFMYAAEKNSFIATLTLFNWAKNKCALLNQKINNQLTTLDLLNPEQCDELIEEQKISKDTHAADAVLSLLKERKALFAQAC